MVSYRCPCCHRSFNGGRWKQDLPSALACGCLGTFSRLYSGVAIVIEDSTNVTIGTVDISGFDTGIKLTNSDATIGGGYFETEVGIEMLNDSRVNASDIVHRSR